MEMTWREKLADWLCGGAVSRAVYGARRDANNYLLRLSRENAKYRDELKAASELNDDLCDHLLQIAHLETPNMAHVGKKAVAIAKRGLGK